MYSIATLEDLKEQVRNDTEELIFGGAGAYGGHTPVAHAEQVERIAAAVAESVLSASPSDEEMDSLAELLMEWAEEDPTLVDREEAVRGGFRGDEWMPDADTATLVKIYYAVRARLMDTFLTEYEHRHHGRRLILLKLRGDEVDCEVIHPASNRWPHWLTT